MFSEFMKIKMKSHNANTVSFLYTQLLKIISKLAQSYYTHQMLLWMVSAVVIFHSNSAK